ncbi:LacI family DNA-binding transcriptional regulator [Cryptosporangium phraense]|uniref:LacI family transcriptional regulator n=1 Tax=Cryptosporangium phraense TaxID=2593070 RepID=A0A545AL21_9ACTN|nr:LacI family DNA-binding transcriptional regulator [Cryptosporangium phraense]TQS42017.1 LacI family transcriptional regulator [Cryptosporangium phraense]
MPRTRVTLKDVARLSGVSPATASFVLNQVPGQTIPAATQARVRQAADELGYVPHGIARALREGTSRIVILNVGRLPRRSTLESFVDGLDAELTRLDHTLLVRYGGSLSRAVGAAAPRAVLDLAGLYASEDPDALDGGWIAGLAAHTLTQIAHLARTGHTAIGFAVPEDPRVARLAELRSAQARTAAAGLGLAEPVTFPVGESAVAGLAALRAGHPEITAVAAFDDDVAIRLLAAARELDVPVPGRLAVIGFDDADYGALWTPALTTVRIDGAAYGRCAARVALGLPPGSLPPDAAVVVERQSA